MVEKNVPTNMVVTIQTIIQQHVVQYGKAPLYLYASPNALLTIRQQCADLLEIPQDSEYVSISGLVIVPVISSGYFLRVGL